MEPSKRIALAIFTAFALAGTCTRATAAGLGVKPGSLSFGRVQAGSTSLARTVTISNRSSAPVTIESITANARFAIATNTCGAVLAPKPATCKVSLTFGPEGVNSSKGTKQTGTLTIIDDASPKPQVVKLNGVAIGSMTPALFVSDFHLNRVSLFAAGKKNGNAAPSATISGGNTGLASPEGIALDSSGSLYVANEFGGPSGSGSVTVYAPGANGNAAPSAAIAGAATMLAGPGGVVVDDSNGNIYVANADGQSVLVFAPGSDGNVAPLAAIIGASTELHEPVGIALDSDRRIYVTNCGTACGGAAAPPSVTVYPPLGNATGQIDQAPIAALVGGSTGFGFPVGIAVDSSGNLFVADRLARADPNSNKHVGCIEKFDAAVIAAGGGNLIPNSFLCRDTGKNCSGLTAPLGVALDSLNDVYATNSAIDGGSTPPSVTVYPPGANDRSCKTESPGVMISGSNTGFSTPLGIVLVE